jgi:hypothetical protein
MRATVARSWRVLRVLGSFRRGTTPEVTREAEAFSSDENP